MHGQSREEERASIGSDTRINILSMIIIVFSWNKNTLTFVFAIAMPQKTERKPKENVSGLGGHPSLNQTHVNNTL